MMNSYPPLRIEVPIEAGNYGLRYTLDGADIDVWACIYCVPAPITA